MKCANQLRLAIAKFLAGYCKRFVRARFGSSQNPHKYPLGLLGLDYLNVSKQLARFEFSYKTNLKSKRL